MLIPIERQRKILNLIQGSGVISIAKLVETLGVSHMTIRRDIQKLEQEGVVVSVSGGVKLLEHLFTEPTHNDKSLLSTLQKENIGRRAAELIPTNTTIYLDAGTTTLEIAHHIAQREDLLVITNDFVIANFLMKNGQCELIHTGGSINKSNFSSVGELATLLLKHLSIDLAFISTSSWNLRGLTTPDEKKLPVKKAILQSSHNKILVSDSSKYGKTATFSICELGVFNRIICDKNLLPNVQESIREMEIELILV